MVLAGCGPEGVWLDNNCTTKEQDIILIAIDKLHDALDEEIIVVEGTGTPDPTGDGGRYYISCDHTYRPNSIRGWWSVWGISISAKNIYSDDQFLGVAMHELGHYAAWNGDHLGEDHKKGAIMYLRAHGTEYSDADIALMKGE